MNRNNLLTEKLRTLGANALSTAELMALVIGDVDAANNLLQEHDHSLKRLATRYPFELKTFQLTERQAAIVSAIFELGRRKLTEIDKETATFQSSADTAQWLQAKLQDYPHEVFCVIFLNRANRVKDFGIISEGGITGTVADPRLILKRAVANNSVSMILGHNHPSGSLRPSRADEDLTYKIKEAAKFFDIKVLDHLIVSQDGYYSFADEGLL